MTLLPNLHIPHSLLYCAEPAMTRAGHVHREVHLPQGYQGGIYRRYTYHRGTREAYIGV